MARCWPEMTHLTMSPMETNPTILSPSITGRWRMRFSVINRMASSTVCWGVTVTTAVEMMSRTGVEREETIFLEDRARGLFDVAAIRKAAAAFA